MTLSDALILIGLGIVMFAIVYPAVRKSEGDRR